MGLPVLFLLLQNSIHYSYDTLNMLFSLRRVFRNKSGLGSKTAEQPIPEPSPDPLTLSRTTYFYSGIHTLHSSEYDEVE